MEIERDGRKLLVESAQRLAEPFLGKNHVDRQVDLRLTKTFDLWSGHAVEATFDAINVFNFKNVADVEQCLCSAQYGDPRTQHLPTRTYQVGLRYRW